jgi:hypothetical protein
MAEHLIIQNSERVAVIVIGKRPRLDAFLLFLPRLNHHRRT